VFTDSAPHRIPESGKDETEVKNERELSREQMDALVQMVKTGRTIDVSLVENSLYYSILL
jgi:hypothetical protein